METPTRIPFPPTLAKAAEGDPKLRYVKIGALYWQEMTYHAALHTVTLERLAAKSAAAGTPRKLMRSLRSMKTEGEFAATFKESISRMVQVEAGKTLAEVRALGGVVVADFPPPEDPKVLDKPIGST